MSATPQKEIRLSYRQAADLMGKDRRTIAEIAQSRSLERPDGKPLDAKGFRVIANILNVPKRIEMVSL